MALRIHLQRVDQGREPGRGFAQQHRCQASGEYFGTQRLAFQRRTVGLHHGQGGGVQLAGHLQLVLRAAPLPEHRQQLEQEHAQRRIGRLRPHLILQRVERLIELAGT